MSALQSSLFTPASHDPGCRRLIRLPSDVTEHLEFDGPNDCYRTKLKHVWQAGLPLIMGLFMNPSGAGTGDRISDATVSKFGRIARRLGFSGLLVGNACSYRATDRMRLLEAPDPVGPKNHQALLAMATESSLIVIGHGLLPGRLQVHADGAVQLLRAAGHKLHVFAFTKEGFPKHPMTLGPHAIPENVVPVEWI